MEDPMPVGRGISIPLTEVDIRTSRSSGPGGQHANVTASRVEATFDVEASEALSGADKRRLVERAGLRLASSAQDTRSQARNRELALERLRDRIADALVVRPSRRPTRPTRAARQRRLESKRRRSETKRARRRPSPGGED
jgi:ribosome-associated protein